MMSTKFDSYMSQHVERIQGLAGNRVASVTPHADYYEVTFRSNPTDDYEFKAFVYGDERMLEINAHRQADLGSLWSRPFELAAFANQDDQWTAFAQLLSTLFERNSRIEVRTSRMFISVACFVEGHDQAIWVVSYPSISERGRQLSALSKKTWHSESIPST